MNSQHTGPSQDRRISLSPFPWPRSRPPRASRSAQAQQMCNSDAFQLCSSEINIPKVAACIAGAHQPQRGCRQLMDKDDCPHPDEQGRRAVKLLICQFCPDLIRGCGRSAHHARLPLSSRRVSPARRAIRRDIFRSFRMPPAWASQKPPWSAPWRRSFAPCA